MRHFSVPELDLFAEQSGFERLSAEAYLTGEVYSEDTWGVCFILRKSYDLFYSVNEPLLDEMRKKYLSQCVDSGWISSEGPFCKSV